MHASVNPLSIFLRHRTPEQHFFVSLSCTQIKEVDTDDLGWDLVGTICLSVNILWSNILVYHNFIVLFWNSNCSCGHMNFSESRAHTFKTFEGKDLSMPTSISYVIMSNRSELHRWSMTLGRRRNRSDWRRVDGICPSIPPARHGQWVLWGAWGGFLSHRIFTTKRCKCK